MPSRLTLAALDRYSEQARQQSKAAVAPPAPTQAFADGELRDLPQPRPPGRSQPPLMPPLPARASPEARFRSGNAESAQRLPPPRPPQQSSPNEPIIKAQARSLKCSCALDPTGFLNVSVWEGTQRVALTINIGGRVFTASVNAKSLRRAVATIKDTGPDNVVVTVQGQLVGDVIEGAGLAAMPKAPKPA